MLSRVPLAQAKAADVNQKLVAADETKKSINEKREQFRPVATRGSVLYFSVVELSLVNVMYQTSLDQFLEIFMGSMDRAEKASLASKRSVFGGGVGVLPLLRISYIDRANRLTNEITSVSTGHILLEFVYCKHLLLNCGRGEWAEVSRLRIHRQ